MPATSKAQQQFMAIAEHEPGKLRGKKPNMSKSQLHDFAATSTKGLPEKKRRGGEVGRKAQAMPKQNGGGFKVSPAVLG